jgi:hypothetical protein
MLHVVLFLFSYAMLYTNLINYYLIELECEWGSSLIVIYISKQIEQKENMYYIRCATG